MRIVADALENGRWASLPSRALSTLYGECARPVRPVSLPGAVRVIGVAGATMGGSYATPVVLALARSLAERCVGVAVVGHGYRCAMSTPRRVRPDDSPGVVGDEALWLARALAEHDVAVVNGTRREASLKLAARHARLVIADALLQARPARLAMSLLVLASSRPFGALRCPPAGDLRAPVRRLLDAADDVLVVDDGAAAERGVESSSSLLPAAAGNRRLWVGRSVLTGARGAGGQVLSPSDIRGQRVGVVLGIARPARVLEALSQNGVVPVATHLFGDHATAERFHSGGRFLREASADLWLTTSKCASKLGATYRGAPVFVLDHRVELPDALLGRMASVAAHSSH